MIALFNRLAWFLALIIGWFLAFLFADIFAGSYSSGAENFFEWGWIWGVIFSLVIKGWFLSEKYIESSLRNTPQNTLESIYQARESTILATEIWEDSSKETTIVTPLTSSYTLPTLLSDNPESLDTNEEEKIEEIYTPSAPSKPNWLVVFFSDRPLAKIGGILLFLGALFFLSLIWAAVGEVGKVLIGILFGFSLYGVGVWMDTRWHIAESRTLLGVGIAINTLTILSGRWIIGDTDSSVLSDSITLIFLLLNTLFAVVTALVYSSRTFLIFSFVFAYLIPFLVGSKSESAILMILYTAIVSLSWYILAYFLSRKPEKSADATWLFHTIFIGSLILMVLSGLGLQTTSDLVVYTLTSLILTVTGIILVRSTTGGVDQLAGLLIGWYIMLLSGLFGMGESSGTLMISLLACVPLMIFTGLQIVAVAASSIFSLIFLAPLIVGIFLLAVFGVTSLPFIIVPILGLYAVASFFILGHLTRVFQYVFFIAIGIFLAIFSAVLDFSPLDLPVGERWILASSVLVFFLISLWSALKHALPNLVVVSTLSSTILLSLILVPSWSGAWIVYIVFLLIAFGFPLFARFQNQSFSPVSFIASQVLLNLFMIGELFFLGKDIWFTDTSSSLIVLGVIIFTLSIASLIYSLILMRVVFGVTMESISRLSLLERNTLSAIFALPLSLFSLSVAVVFSDTPLIVSTVWILESTILAYFSGKTKSVHILAWSLVLLAIGLIRIVPFFDTVREGDWLDLVPLALIAVSLFFWLKHIAPRETASAHFYDILHVVGIAAVGIACIEIIPHTQTGWSLLGMSLFLFISTWFYRGVVSKIISLWVCVVGIFYFLYHFARVESLTHTPLPLLIQLWALALALFSTWRTSTFQGLEKLAFVFGSVMTLLITSLYVNEITESIFAVTIYLTILSSLFIFRGITRDTAYLRTVGLYIGSAVLIKILFYDLWFGFGDLTIRVLALMISWGVMIALSQLYGNSVKRTWSEEFSFENFASSLPKDRKKDTPTDTVSSSSDDMPFSSLLAEDISKLDIGHIASIALMDNSDEKVFESKRVGIIRIVNYIVSTLGKERFAPWELHDVYENVLPHIRSSLPKKDLEDILSAIASWISSGWSIELISKTSKK